MNTLKEHLAKTLRGIIEEIIPQIPSSAQERHARELLLDLENEKPSVVVLGEFKRGKSTMINALLGDEILPADVTPTTATINIVRWGEEPEIIVHSSGGEKENLPFTPSILNSFVFSAEFDPQKVAYLEIIFPAPVLKEGIIVVDTPGINDLSRHGTRITYDFLPRADVVVFLLDALTPLRRTEERFLSDVILKDGLEKFVFVINGIDRVSQEEREEVVAEAKRRIERVLQRSCPVYPLSAKNALRAKKINDPAGLAASGLPEIESVILELTRDGTMAIYRDRRFCQRTGQLLDALEREARAVAEELTMSAEQLAGKLQSIEQLALQKEKRRQAIDSYLSERYSEILAMVRKSLDHLGEELREETLHQLDIFNGPNFGDFIEKNISWSVRKRLKNWLETQWGHVLDLFNQVEKHITDYLAKEFNESVNLPAIKRDLLQPIKKDFLQPKFDFRWQLEAKDIFGVNIQAGLISAGAGIFSVLALGSGIFMPIVTLAGYPLIREFLHKKALKEARQKILPQLQQALDQVLEGFNDYVIGVVKTDMETIRSIAEERFDELLAKTKERLEKEAALLQEGKQDVIQKRENLYLLCEKIAGLRKEISMRCSS